MINGSEGDRNRGPEARLFFDDRIVVVHERAKPRQRIWLLTHQPVPATLHRLGINAKFTITLHVHGSAAERSAA